MTLEINKYRENILRFVASQLWHPLLEQYDAQPGSDYEAIDGEDTQQIRLDDTSSQGEFVDLAGEDLDSDGSSFLAESIAAEKTFFEQVDTIVCDLSITMETFQSSLVSLEEQLSMAEDAPDISDAIIQAYALSLKWFSDANVSSLLPGVLKCEAHLVALPLSNNMDPDRQLLPSWRTYDTIKAELISDLFRIAILVNFDDICEEKIPNYKRLVPAEAGVLIYAGSLSSIEAINQFELSEHDTLKRNTNLFRVATSMQKLVVEQQQAFDRFSEQQIAPQSLLTFSSTLPKKRNEFLDDLYKLISSNSLRAGILPQAKEQYVASFNVP